MITSPSMDDNETNANAKKWYEESDVLLASLFMAMLASAIASVQIALHLRNYSNPAQQRHILRIIFLVCVYSIFSFAALWKPSISLDLDTIRDAYESWVVYNFLALCFEYVGGPGNVQNNMQGRELRASFWACTREATAVDGAYLRRSKQYALQFVFLKPFLSLISWIMHMRGHYGDSKLDFTQGYVYVLFCYNISYTMALYGLMMFYRGAYDLLKPHKPLAKFLLVKAVIFLTFWQSAFIALAVATGDVSSPEEGRATQDFLVCVEMVFASVFMHIAFPYTVYQSRSGDSRFVANVGHALSVGDVLDDTVHQFGRTYQDYTLHGASDNSEAQMQAPQMQAVSVGRDDRDSKKKTTVMEEVVLEETDNPYSYSIATPSPRRRADNSNNNSATTTSSLNNPFSNLTSIELQESGDDKPPPLLEL